MSERWFHVAGIGAVGERVELEREESRHAVGARRLRDGATVTLFDGMGTVATGALVERGRAVLVESVESQASPSCALEIATAIPKGDRAATMLDMATQLGMTAFLSLSTRHGVVEAGERSLPRWERICLEACKQSRRAWRPTIHRETVSPEIAVRTAVEAGLDAFVADRDGEAPTPDATGGGGVRVLVGPEGGFDPTEIAAMRAAGAKRLRLGAHVLRIETAVVAACALFGARRGA